MQYKDTYVPVTIQESGIRTVEKQSYKWFDGEWLQCGTGLLTGQVNVEWHRDDDWSSEQAGQFAAEIADLRIAAEPEIQQSGVCRSAIYSF